MGTPDKMWGMNWIGVEQCLSQRKHTGGIIQEAVMINTMNQTKNMHSGDSVFRESV